MGYRSDVGLCLTKAGKEAFETRLAELAPEKAEKVRGLIDCAQSRSFDKESGAIGWYWSSVKWYYEYMEVEFFLRLFHELDEEDYAFIEIGEAGESLAESGNFWNNPFCMRIVKAIAFIE